MSGIVGILNLDGAPADHALLRQMTNFMSFRGPDEQRIWVDGHVGFGHSLLRTTDESEREHQPFTLDGRLWIVADARVDAQADLISKLAARGESVESGVTDVELLLRAYRVWGEECVNHLLGDFAFAVWDSPKCRLFCARDHLGVKPFFYAHLGPTLIFSNTLDCIRQHPIVSDRLNDLAIADFLLFDMNQEPTTTSFADIERMPPAHSIIWSADGRKLKRYWTLPIDEPLYFKRADDYTDRFKELLDVAVSDRLRTNKIAILMSGGIDSPTLAQTARSILRLRSSDSEVHAFTTVISGLDRNEGYYAKLVAHHIGIPIHVRDRSVNLTSPTWDQAEIHTSEPVTDPTNLAEDRSHYLSIGARARVLFYGEGPDNALRYEWGAYSSYLMRKRRFGRLVLDICGHAVRHRRIPLLTTIPRMFKDRADRSKWLVPFPDWLNENFESRLHLRSRSDEQEKSPPPDLHPLRPLGYHSFQTPNWQLLFNGVDAGETKAPLEVRHPFVDLRLLRYMLAVPAIPWCRAKYIERRAMRGLLPDSILRRPKSPLTSDPVWEAARRLGLPPLHPTAAISQFVDTRRVPKDAGSDMVLFRMNFRPIALSFWLNNLAATTRN